MTDKNLLEEVLDGRSNYKNDPALKQGIQFNKEQSQLNIKEGFSSKDKKSLEQVDKKEGVITGQLAQEFDAKMSEYTRQFDARLSGAMHRPTPPLVYGINTAEEIYTKNSQGSPGGWNMPNSGARLMNISATGKTHLWGVNSNDTIYKCKRPCARGEWEEVPGGLKQLSADDQYVYGVNRNDAIYRMNEDGTGGWQRLGGALKNISASGKGWVWGVNSGDEIYKCRKPCSGAWEHVPGLLKQVAGDKDYVWGVNNGNMIFKMPISGTDSWDWSPSTRGAGMSGANVNRLLWVSPSAPNYVWGVGSDRRMWFCKKPCTDGNWATKGVYGNATQVEGDNGASSGAASTNIKNQDQQAVAALATANAELMAMAGQLWERTSKLRTEGGKAQGALQEKRAKLREQMELLQTRMQLLNALKGGNVTLDEKLTSRRQDLDSIYIHYLAWFGAAAAFAAIAAHKMMG